MVFQSPARPPHRCALPITRDYITDGERRMLQGKQMAASAARMAGE